ncbi:glycosyltransferase family 2 protein [candidate division CSSED10-310 bacterium]|uniref:Glycosyltransferase family 2 protein n=1 Tax=candidate division CSSED10-310 bacterium TaxID=2855610 RepID=A0ABV6YYU8_UNCC1
MSIIGRLPNKLKDNRYLFKSLLRGRLPSLFKLYDSIKLSHIARNVTPVFGPSTINYRTSEAIVLCLVKDGETWIKDFILHYKKKGFKHIVFLDNGSTDNTLKIAKKHKNVTILKTEIPFKENNILLRRYLINRFSKNRWSLTVDIDELWDFPFSDKVNLNNLLKYFKTKSANAVVAQMLDMYMPTIPTKKQPLKSYDLYDISHIKKDALTMPFGFKDCGLRYRKMLNKNIKFFRGGIRAQLFGLDYVWLTKIPLIFNNKPLKPIIHQHFSNDAKIADISTVLLHYKFTHGFKEQVKNAVRHEQYLNDSKEYKQYLTKQKNNPYLKLKQSTAKRLKSVNQLVNEDFLVVSNDYLKIT